MVFVCLLFVLSFSGGGRCLSWLGAKSKCSYCTFRFSQSGWLFITVSTDNSEMSKVPAFKPRNGQNIVFRASSLHSNTAYLLSGSFNLIASGSNA